MGEPPGQVSTVMLCIWCGLQWVRAPRQMCPECQVEDPLQSMQDRHRAGVVRPTLRGTDA